MKTQQETLFHFLFVPAADLYPKILRQEAKRENDTTRFFYLMQKSRLININVLKLKALAVSVATFRTELNKIAFNLMQRSWLIHIVNTKKN